MNSSIHKKIGENQTSFLFMNVKAKVIMKKSNVFFKTAFLLTTAVLIGCSSDEVAQNEKQNGNNGNSLAKTVTFTGENILPTRISATKTQSQDPTTRTWITHTVEMGLRPFGLRVIRFG